MSRSKSHLRFPSNICVRLAGQIGARERKSEGGRERKQVRGKVRANANKRAAWRFSSAGTGREAEEGKRRKG
eukprot:2587283-Rhodomonas_salina.1